MLRRDYQSVFGEKSTRLCPTKQSNMFWQNRILVGKNRSVIDKFVDSIRDIPGLTLISVASEYNFNHTVVTMIHAPGHQASPGCTWQDGL